MGEDCDWDTTNTHTHTHTHSSAAVDSQSVCASQSCLWHIKQSLVWEIDHRDNSSSMANKINNNGVTNTQDAQPQACHAKESKAIAHLLSSAT